VRRKKEEERTEGRRRADWHSVPVIRGENKLQTHGLMRETGTRVRNEGKIASNKQKFLHDRKLGTDEKRE
jgi:hypothetical protein